MSEQLVRTQSVQDDKFALFDLDGTLIDAGYNVTDAVIRNAVHDAKDAGWTLGLSSDSSYEYMRGWSEDLGMNGPIIAEKGAHVVEDLKSMTQVGPTVFTELRDTAQEYFIQSGLKVWRGEPAPLIKSGEPFPLPAQEGEVVILVNAYRRNSFGYFVRRIGKNGTMHVDAEENQHIAEQVRGLYNPETPVDEDLNHEHSLMIVSAKGMHKRTGSLALMARLGITRFAMIGNSKADYLGKDIAAHLAVGNADADFKEVADFIAEKPVSGGAAEALGALVAGVVD